MASPPSKHTIHVVGGAGTQSDKSDQNGGGYVEGGTATYSTFQGANGGPTSDSSAWNGSQTACVLSDRGDGKTRVTKAGAFSVCVVGSLANVAGEDAGFSDGIYEVIAVDGSGNYIDIDDSFVYEDTGADIKVGGAFATLQAALDDDSTNAAGYNRTIYTNLAETLAAAIDIDTGGGDVSKNTHKRVIGFNSAPGDMDYGGAYYQSPLDAYKNGIDTNKCVRYNGNGMADSTFAITEDNIGLRNLYPYNNERTSGHFGVELGSTGTVPSNLIIRNCKFSYLFRAASWECDGIAIINCYSHSDVINKHYDMAYLGGTTSFSYILGCVINAVFDRTIRIASGYGIVAGNIIIGDGVNTERGLQIEDAKVIAHNNTFYGYTIRAISLEHAAATLIEFNNIFVLTAVDDYAVCALAANGTILYSDYSWAYCAAGDFTVEPWYDDTNDVGFQGAHSTKDVDPQLVDPANGDFRLVNPDVLRGGRPDADDNAGQIGAIIQKYQFAERGRLTNRGRLGTFR